MHAENNNVKESDQGGLIFLKGVNYFRIYNSTLKHN